MIGTLLEALLLSQAFPSCPLTLSFFRCANEANIAIWLQALIENPRPHPSLLEISRKTGPVFKRTKEGMPDLRRPCAYVHRKCSQKPDLGDPAPLEREPHALGMVDMKRFAWDQKMRVLWCFA